MIHYELVIHCPQFDEAARAELLAQLDVGGNRVLIADSGPRIALSARSDDSALIDQVRAAGADAALLPAGARLQQFGLIVMDMDSTMITIECIDELAHHAGVKPQVAAITERSMRGEIDFSASLKERVGLLAGLPEHSLQRVFDDRLAFSPGAQALIDAARARGVHTLLVSGGFTWFTERVREQLGIDEAYGNELELTNGSLTGRLLGSVLDGAAKAAHLRACAERLGLAREQVMAIGDGANDLAMMAAAGTSVAYHAKPKVRAAAALSIEAGGLDTLLSWFPPRPQ